MANMTLSIPEALHERMRKYPEIGWSTLARETFNKRVSELEWMDSVLGNSELTEKDVERIGKAIKREIRRRIDSS